MLEYQLVDYRTPQLGGEDRRADLDDLGKDFTDMAVDGWRVVQLVGALTDERILVVFERET